jgi:hypothetical protein
VCRFFTLIAAIAIGFAGTAHGEEAKTSLVPDRPAMQGSAERSAQMARMLAGDRPEREAIDALLSAFGTTEVVPPSWTGLRLD